MLPVGSGFHGKSTVAKCKAIILHKYALLLRGDEKKKTNLEVKSILGIYFPD